MTPKQIFDSNKYPFTEGQLKFYMLHRKENGLDIAIRKMGKCLFIRMDLFEMWIESYRENKND
jgi:hypothetical protein